MKKKLSLFLCFALLMGVLTVNMTEQVGAAYADYDFKSASNKADSWFSTSEAITLADDIIKFQKPDGGWKKDMDGSDSGVWGNSTIDNNTTWTQIIILSRVYKATGTAKYRDAADKGLDLFFNGQYPSGGWPLVFGNITSYHRAITYNDDAMMGVMRIIRDVKNKSGHFDWVDSARVAKAKIAYDKGIECILNTQIKSSDGTLTAWGQQHDPVTFVPVKGREFEPAAIVTSESVNVVQFLRQHGLENPSREVAIAVNSAINWFKATEIKGYQWVTQGDDKALVANSSATQLWSRFYEIGTNIPVFGDRDGKVYYDVKQISLERRVGYSWYGNWGRNVTNLALLPVPDDKPPEIPLLNGTLIKELQRLDTVNYANWSIRTNFKSGDALFGDRDFTATSMQGFLNGAEWIRTACDSKGFSGNQAQFKAGANVSVYVLLDSRVVTVHGLPEWLSSWQDTGMKISVSNGETVRIYKKDFNKDASVVLGTHPASGVMNYAVAVTLPVTIDTTVATTASTTVSTSGSSGSPSPTAVTTTTESSPVTTTASSPVTTTSATVATSDSTTTSATVATTTSDSTTTAVTSTTTTSDSTTSSAVTTTSETMTTQPTTTTSVTTTTQPTTTTSATTTTQPTITDTTQSATTNTTSSEMTATTTADSTSGSSGSPSPTTSGSTEESATATDSEHNEPRLVGDVDCNGTVTINDALEILKHLAKLSSEIDNGGNNRKNAIILGGESPTINDALEILKYLAKLESKVGVYITDTEG
ncbi:MAG: pectate lyase [Oscillospiraceae bacterium]|nr:pectate lyase [Oscillospiraceae bacterium]